MVLFNFAVKTSFIFVKGFIHAIGEIRMSELPLAAVDRIIRKAAGIRVSESAAKELAVHLEEVGMKVSQEASLYAKHAGRKTVTDEDIRLVLKK